MAAALAAACGDAPRTEDADRTPAAHTPDLVIVEARTVADGLALRVANQSNGAFQGRVVLDAAQDGFTREAERSIDLAPYDDGTELIVGGEWELHPGAPSIEAHVGVADGPDEARTDNNTITVACNEVIGECDVS
ncbi:MAG: hypothetical protein U5Q44_16015 [Dehalococcoidia bacterium]|nr:hypothetical protein [Dehalococcoidia bacterium]